MRSVLLCVAVVSLAAGCGQPPPSGPDGGGGEVGVDAGGGIGPTLLTSSPSNGAIDVPPLTPVVLEFSEPLDRASFTVSANPPALFDSPVFEFNDTVVTLTPSAPLMADTQYLVQGAMKDREGNAGSFSVGFHVVAPDTTSPTLEQSSPTGQDVGLETPVVLTFSEPMDLDSVTVTTVPAMAFAPAVWNDAQTEVTLAPSMPWSVSTDYQVTVGGKDLAGNLLGGTVTFSFGTLTPSETKAPTVIGHSPTSGAPAPLNARISIAFSEPMLTSTVEPMIAFVPGVTCAFEWSPAHDAVTCTPAEALTASTSYTVTVGTGARDTQANALKAAYTFSFDTGTVEDLVAPTIAGSTPDDMEIGVPRASSLSITFSEPMDVAATLGALAITGPAGVDDGTISWDQAGKVLTFNPKAQLPYGAQVTWTLGADARDTAGNALVGIRQGTFRVIQTGMMDLPATIDGHVSNSGVACSTCDALIVGSDSATVVFRALFGFDLSALPPSTSQILTASLNIYQEGCDGNPFGTLGLLRAESVDFGPTIASGDYGAPLVGPSTSVASSCAPRWIAATVTSSVAADLANTARMGRSQFRLRFSQNLATWGQNRILLTSHLAGANAPYLRVSYEYP